MSRCTDHIDWTNETCPECGLEVDPYGNTEAQPFDYCTFPDCGCDGARLCMAGEASDNAARMNVEGMWSRKGSEKIDDGTGRTIGQARMELHALVRKGAQ